MKTSQAYRRWVTLSLPVFFAAILAGCASLSLDAGMGAVNDVAARELRADVIKVSTEQDVAEAHAQMRRLLKSPLSVEGAVRIALLNNKGLQAAYNELGIAEAAMVGESLPPNPTFSLSRIWTRVELDIEGAIALDILALATLPARAEIAAERFHQAQLRAAEETLRLGIETRRNYYRSVAAVQLVASLTQATSAAETAARLAKRLGETGAMNKLDQAREDVFYADLVAQLAAARERATSERERLVRSLGLWGNELGFKLPQALPALPKQPRSLLAVEIEAIRQRVDLQIARIEVDALAKSYGLTNATRFINLLDAAGIVRNQQEDIGHGTGGGPQVAFQIPIFDFGEVRLRQVGETYMKAVNRLTEKAVDARSEAREAYQLYRASYDLANHYRNEVLPLRQIISDETMLRYNAMQIDVFPLLTEAQRRIAANTSAIEAQRGFWLATVDLDAAVLGGGIAGSENVTRITATSAAE